MAQGRLMERHRRTVYAVALQALRNADDAYDVSQEALVYALQRLPELRDAERFAGWLRRITLSCCADFRRRRSTRTLGSPIDPLHASRPAGDPADRIVVDRALAGLTEAHRETVMLRYVAGWSIEEVASVLAIPPNTVRSRLAAAKRCLRDDLRMAFPERIEMPTKARTLTSEDATLLLSVFPGAAVMSVQRDPMAWMPFSPRVQVRLADGDEKTVDFRHDVDADRAELVETLHRLGIPGPRLLCSPVDDGRGGSLCLCEPPAGVNLHAWALQGTPHRIRLATERSFEAIDMLQGVTAPLLHTAAGQKLARRTLADEALLLSNPDAPSPSELWYDRLRQHIAEWRSDPWFTAALARVREAVADIREPLVYTDYLHFNPYFLYIRPAADPFDTPLGWPGDARLQMNPISEIVSPCGHYGDPLLGLSMVWIYDWYPFVHTGFVEQFLWRRNVSRREFAPRLALKALQTMARELPVERPAEGAEYWEALHGYVEQAFAWMD